ncbi:hypothetical protein [Microbulbifer sp. SAOS-129_SWC]|uniref:hypothetical protein n=1 Tax=Microbulbifer sp. SAOS-129_SWC TaxID=3145235 RepID=UPI0032178248
MVIHIPRNSHRYLSVALFLFCFLFIPFYTSETYKAQSSTNLLLLGWLGLLAGYFSWLANPAYLVAVIFKKRKITILFSVLALILSLSFLEKERLVVSEAPTYEAIVAYGPGYFLWTLSFFTLFLGEILATPKIKESHRQASLISAIIFLTLIYGAYYCWGNRSIYHIFSEREKNFMALCSKVQERQYKPVRNIKGVYIDYIPGNYFRDISGHKYGAHGGTLISYIRGGYYDFEERTPYSEKETTLPFVRIYANAPNKRLPIKNLESNYSVTSIDLASGLPDALGIESYKIIIKSLETGEIYAESSFATIENELKICAPTDSSTYSVSGFVFNALNLQKNH